MTTCSLELTLFLVTSGEITVHSYKVTDYTPKLNYTIHYSILFELAQCMHFNVGITKLYF